jgi:hypothetical protein
MSAFDALNHFAEGEFNDPDEMYQPFLMWLDRVRATAAVPFVVTSDFRDHIPPGGFADSLHLKGRAIDFRWNQTAEERAKIVQAVMTTPRPDGEGGFELGLEPGSPGGAHWHLGLFQTGRESRLFVK